MTHQDIRRGPTNKDRVDFVDWAAMGQFMAMIGRRSLRTADDVAEVVANTWVKLLQARRDEEATAFTRAYVATAMRSSINDFIGRSYYRPDEPRAEVPDLVAEPIDPVALRDIAQTAHDALKALSPKHAQIVEMILDGDASSAEIARAFDTTPHNVDQIKYAWRRKVRERLDN